MQITGQITWVSDIANRGKENSITIQVTEQEGQYPNEALFEIYGDTKVENFFKYNALNDIVTVEFNSRVYVTQDGRRFCNLSAWKVNK